MKGVLDDFTGRSGDIGACSSGRNDDFDPEKALNRRKSSAAHRHRRRTGRHRKKPSPDREESAPSRRAYTRILLLAVVVGVCGKLCVCIDLGF